MKLKQSNIDAVLGLLILAYLVFLCIFGIYKLLN